MMGKVKDRLKVYCETSFWSWLVSRPSSNPDHAVKQAWTRKWWEEAAPKCEIYISQYVTEESSCGDPKKADERLLSMRSAFSVDGMIPEASELADLLIKAHAVPADEATDASHIATAAVYGMGVLLTWNCRHMANPVTLPKTAEVITSAGFHCPIIITPVDFLKRRKEFAL